ncbi:Glycoside hydrolase family 18 protein [Mycena indigotica]|uniref:Glycoside hydrolase family 18 protein n=1 Tax=Mycena indigotica TaxID=2126181 RepID=A0A8H6T2I0_9AGAR|nr:Glycoside hydrolase family 18 protein [Mycena indigotica]KAF7309788.1 Glycoside hydrolase family 18 protein [Mycena indigotica]
MVALPLVRLLAFVSSILLVSPLVNSIPTNGTEFAGLDHKAREILSRATPAAPHWVIYGDAYVPGTTGPPAVSAVTGFNVFVLSFLLIEGAWDKAYEWTTLTAAERASIKSQYNAAGIKIMVSAFGSTDVPTSTNANPTTLATTMANWVIQWGLDGIDVDYEDFNAFDAGNGSAENWLITFTTQLRALLPTGQYIITHAPVAPWFSPNKWGGGGYLRVHQAVGNLIDWYNIQFYNQGTNEYTTCNNLLTTSSSTWPNSAVFQIAASGVPLSKIVIGKPAGTGYANNGFMDAATLATCVSQAKAKSWNGGAMVWEYPGAGAAWIKTVRGSAFP